MKEEIAIRTVKLKKGFSEIIKVEKFEYEIKTKKEKPYYLKNNKGDLVNYAVCPYCDNPVQIIGLYKRLKNTEKPFARHNQGNVPKLANYSHQSYLDCPVAIRRHLQKDNRKNQESENAREILELLRNQFDRVVYLLSKDTHIKYSENLLRQMLDIYIASGGHLYTGATLYNLPWIFAYMSNAQTLFSQSIIKDSDLHLAINENCPGALFKELEGGKYVQLLSKKGHFLQLNFSFIWHRIDEVDNDVKETVRFCVYEGNGTPPRDIFQKTIEIEPKYFYNLINLKVENARRNNKLLAIASELI